MSGVRPVFDRDAFDRRVGGDRALALEILQMFIEDCPQRLAAIRSAVDKGDANGLRTAAHTLKGSAGYLAAAFVVEAAAELEGLGRQGQLAAAPAVLARLERAVAELVPEVERARLAS